MNCVTCKCNARAIGRYECEQCSQHTRRNMRRGFYLSVVKPQFPKSVLPEAHLPTSIHDEVELASTYWLMLGKQI